MAASTKSREGSIERTCGDCQHFEHESAQEDYSEITPGNEFSMRCAKQHWKFDPFTVTAPQLAQIFGAARECADFVERPLVCSICYCEKCTHEYARRIKT